MTEDDKKKKRNKKKKNNINRQQQQSSSSSSSQAAAVAANNNNNNRNDNDNDDNNNTNNKEVAEGRYNKDNGGVAVAVTTQDTASFSNQQNYGNAYSDLNNNANPLSQPPSSSLESDERQQQWLQTQNALEERIRELEKANDLHIQKEGTLEGRIRELQNANGMHLQKQANFEETIANLRNANDSLLQKEECFNQTSAELQSDNRSLLQKQDTLEQRIRELEKANDLYVQKEAGLEMKFAQLQSERDSWLQKEMSREEKVKHFENEKDSWILKENSMTKTIAVLNNDVAKGRAQVLELEESKKLLLQENQQLKENMSSMQFKIEELEKSLAAAPSIDVFTKLASEKENLNSEIEAAQGLIEKLITENAELVEKMNELYIELHKQGGAAMLSPASDHVGEALKPSQIAHVPPEFSDTTRQQIDSPDVSLKDEKTDHNRVNDEHFVVVTNPSEPRESGEIVQIPLNDVEVGDPEAQVTNNDEKPAVPLSDAPLTGAPFRLISSFARYISGADIAEKNSPNSRN